MSATLSENLILHVGIGSHAARAIMLPYYQKLGEGWQVIGVNRSGAIKEALKPHAYSYDIHTNHVPERLSEKLKRTYDTFYDSLHPPLEFGFLSGTMMPEQHTQRITCLSDILLQDDVEAVQAHIASPALRLMTLTITQPGYGHDPKTGLLDRSREDVAQCTIDRPITTIGLIAAGLQQRCKNGLPGVTLMSADNIPNNSTLLQNLLLEYAIEHDAHSLADYISKECHFPLGMIDRRVPKTPAEQCTADAGWPLYTEAYSRWAVGDNMPESLRETVSGLGVEVYPHKSRNKAPNTEEISIEQVLDEKASINAMYFLMGMVVQLEGSETTANPTIQDLFSRETYMGQELFNGCLSLATALQKHDVHYFDDEKQYADEKYFAKGLARLFKPKPNDDPARFCRNGIYKIQQYCAELFKDACLENDYNHGILPLSFTIAAWLHMITGKTLRGDASFAIQDNSAQTQALQKIAAEEPAALIPKAIKMLYQSENDADPKLPAAVLKKMTDFVTIMHELITEKGAIGCLGSHISHPFHVHQKMLPRETTTYQESKTDYWKKHHPTSPELFFNGIDGVLVKHYD